MRIESDILNRHTINFNIREVNEVTLKTCWKYIVTGEVSLVLILHRENENVLFFRQEAPTAFDVSIKATEH